MPSVHFPYDESGHKAATQAVGLHPKARMSSGGGKGNYPKPNQPQPRKKPRRSDDVPSGNKAY